MIFISEGHSLRHLCPVLITNGMPIVSHSDLHLRILIETIGKLMSRLLAHEMHEHKDQNGGFPMLMTMRTNWHAAISGIAVLFATFNAFATCPTPGTSDARMYLIVNNTSNPSTARITLAKIGFDVVKVDGFHVKKIGATNFSNYSSFPAAATGLEAANNSASSIAGLKWDGYAAISDYLLIGNAYVGTSSSNAQFWYHDLECNAVYQITNVVWSAN